MNCKTIGGINVDTQRSMPNNTISAIQRDTVTADQLIESILSPMDSLDHPNFEGVMKDKELIAKALKRIPDLQQYGLILNSEGNHISEATGTFLSNIIRNELHASDFVNKLGMSGIYNGGEVTNIVRKNGKYTTKNTAEQLNTAVTKFLGTRLVTSDDYITGKQTDLKISRKLVDDLNIYFYNQYTNTIGVIAEGALFHSKEVPTVYRDSISHMKSIPLLTHMDKQIFAQKRVLDEMKEKDVSYYDSGLAASINEEINDIEKQKLIISKKVTLDYVLKYYKKQLDEMEAALNPEDGVKETFSKERLESYLYTIKLVKNSMALTPEDNPLLEDTEVTDREIRDALGVYQLRAQNIELEVLEEVVKWAHEYAESNLGVDHTREELLTVSGLKHSWSRYFQPFLGIHHLGSPLVQMVANTVDEANTWSFYEATDKADKIEELYGPAMTVTEPEDYIQRTEEGRFTGKFVDVFSDRWTKSKFKMLGGIGKSKNGEVYVTRANKFQVDNMIITLNPEVLFDGDKRTKKYKELRKLIYDSLGEDKGKLYEEEAKRLWEVYKTALKSEKERVTGTEEEKEQKIHDWVMLNSPMEHIAKGHMEIYGTTDRFLLRIPRKFDKRGQSLGFYDAKYEKIMSHPESREFYNYVNKVSVDHQNALHNYKNKFEPATLAYIGKSIAEHLGNKDYKEALNLFGRDLLQDYAIKERVPDAMYPRDPVTMKPSLSLKYEIHSIPVEARRRIRDLLAADEEYGKLTNDTIDEIDRKKEIKKEYTDKVYADIEAERSNDLLQSIIMSVYSTESFIQKRTRETGVNLLKDLLESPLVDVKGAGQEATKKAEALLQEHLTYYINQAFYDGRDRDITTPIAGDVEDEDKDKSVVTTQRISKVLQSGARVLVLGWSPIHAVLNVGQQFFSNLAKASEGNYFTFGELMKAYGDVTMKEKDRSIVDKLFIVGDIAYTYEKRNIYEQNKLWSKLHPMYFQSHAEKYNQSATSIAVIRHLQVTNSSTGETGSLYDALNDDGSLDEKYRHAEYGDRKGTDLLIKLTIDKIRPAVRQTAGDYLSPLYAEKSELGKLALMFKKWLPEMIADRLHEKKWDASLKKETEGRFRALVAASGQVMTGTSFKELKETDIVRYEAARAGLFEVSMALLLRGLFMGTAYLMCDTPDCKNKRGPALLALNMLGRLADDVQQLAQPYRLTSNILNPFAIEGTITDLIKFSDDLSSIILPGGDGGRYKSTTEDHDKGDIRAAKSLDRLKPGYRTLYELPKKYSNKVYFNATLTGFIDGKAQ